MEGRARRLDASTPSQTVGLLDPGIREVAAKPGAMTAAELIDG
jgi:hypothetical protein